MYTVGAKHLLYEHSSLRRMYVCNCFALHRYHRPVSAIRFAVIHGGRSSCMNVCAYVMINMQLLRPYSHGFHGWHCPQHRVIMSSCHLKRGAINGTSLKQH